MGDRSGSLRHRNNFSLFLAVLLFTLPAPALASVIFNHQAPERVEVQEDFAINAIITGLSDGASVFVYHRSVTTGDYEFITTEVTGGVLDAFIPGEFVNAPGLEYYLVVQDDSGEIFTFPEGAPATGPFQVKVGSSKAPTRSGSGFAPVLSIVAPGPGVALNTADLVVVVACYDQDGDFDPSSLTLRVNGIDVTGDALITPDVITWLPNDQSPRGNLFIEVTAADLTGNQAPATALTCFIIDSKPHGQIAPPTGSLVLDGRFTGLEGPGASSRQEPERTLFGRLDAAGRLGILHYRVKAYRTSDDKSTTQPRNRLRLDLTAGPVKARLGDVTPRFNPLTIWGKRMRGVEVTLNRTNFFGQVLYGTTRRAIEGAGYDSLDVTAPSGRRTILEDTGTFARNLRGLRFGVGYQNPFGLNLCILRIKDDTGSIVYGLKPKDNTVIGTDLDLRFFNRRLVFNAAAAMSWLTDDISGGALTAAEADTTFGIDLPFDPEDLDNLLILNASTTPLDPRGLSNVALHSTTRGLLGGHLFELRLRRIGSVYRSLASSSLPHDYSGFRLKDSFSLLKNRFRVTGEYQSFHNNLSKDHTNTRETSIFGGNVAYTPRTGHLTALRTGFRLYGQSNGETSSTEGVKNSTRVFTLGGNLRFPFDNLTENIHLNYLISNRNDDIAAAGESKGDNLTLETRTVFSTHPLSLSLLLGRATNRYPGLVGVDGQMGITADFITIQFGSDYRMKELLWRVVCRRVQGKGDMAGADAARTSLNLAAEYSYSEQLAITGRLGYTGYDDRSVDNQDYDETFFRMNIKQRF